MGVEPTHSSEIQAQSRSGSNRGSWPSRILAGVGVLAAVIIATLIWYVTSSNADNNDSYEAAAPQTSATTNLPTPTIPSSAWLWCPDCAQEGMPINVWQMAGKNRGSVVTSAPHRTGVTPTQKVQGDDGRTWYHVSVDGSSGYVPVTFLTFTDPIPESEPTSEPTPAHRAVSVDLPTPTSTFEPVTLPTVTPDNTARFTPSPTPAVMAQVKVGNLNVRKGPGANYEILTTIRANEQYTILALSLHKLWAKLDVAGTEGWAYTEYLSLEHGVVPVDGSLLEHEVPASMPNPRMTATPTAVNTATATFTP